MKWQSEPPTVPGYYWWNLYGHVRCVERARLR